MQSLVIESDEPDFSALAVTWPTWWADSFAKIVPYFPERLIHRVIGANSGLHALDILRSEQQIDLMMTDHVMPGMTGIELAASRKVRPSLPILLATGYAELPEGAQLDLPRLAKPYHQDELRDRLEQLLR
jgi:CheY-like chemotaxis protein